MAGENRNNGLGDILTLLQDLRSGQALTQERLGRIGGKIDGLEGKIDGLTAGVRAGFDASQANDENLKKSIGEVAVGVLSLRNALEAHVKETV